MEEFFSKCPTSNDFFLALLKYSTTLTIVINLSILLIWFLGICEWSNIETNTIFNLFNLFIYFQSFARFMFFLNGSLKFTMTPEISQNTHIKLDFVRESNFIQ